MPFEILTDFQLLSPNFLEIQQKLPNLFWKYYHSRQKLPFFESLTTHSKTSSLKLYIKSILYSFYTIYKNIL